MEDKNRVSCLYISGDNIDGFQARIVIWESVQAQGCTNPPITLLQDLTFKLVGSKLYMDAGKSIRKREK
jgi:hypothetical protein